MDGVLLVDKPAGPTSHDVVARLRKTSGERAVGHTGTLDPAATGLLPLVFGRATRLASWLTGRNKSYDAIIQLGWATDTDDADGAPVGERRPVSRDLEQVGHALATFRGAIAQTPPRHSAKRIQGQRAYDLARRQQDVVLPAVDVTVTALELVSVLEDRLVIRLTASAGFYVRALARDVGDQLGCGGHLLSLRRTRSGSFDVANAVPLEAAERMGPDVADRLVPPAEALLDLAGVELTDLGLKRALHGNPVGPEHLVGRWLPPPSGSEAVRLLAADGRLVALARSRGGALHPAVVLG